MAKRVSFLVAIFDAIKFFVLAMSDSEAKVGLNHSKFLTDIPKIAKALHHLFKVEPKDISGLYLDNCVEVPLISVATWLNGGAVSVGDFSLTAKVISLQLDETKPKVIFCQGQNLERILQARQMVGLYKVPIVLVHSKEEKGQENVFKLETLMEKAASLTDLPKELNDHYDPDDVLVIKWSSGKQWAVISR